MAMKVLSREHGDQVVATENQRAVAMRLLEQGYLFYEVASFDAPAGSSPVAPQEMSDAKDYLALRRFAGG